MDLAPIRAILVHLATVSLAGKPDVWYRIRSCPQSLPYVPHTFHLECAKMHANFLHAICTRFMYRDIIIS